MRPDAKSLARLKRLERVRRIERAEAAREAASAQAAADRLAALATRSAGLAADYRSHQGATSGDALQSRVVFGSETIALSQRTAEDSTRAADNAARQRIALAHSTRRRDIAGEQVRANERTLVRAAEQKASLARSLNRRGGEQKR